MINDVTKFMSYQHGNIVWAPDPNDLGRSPRFDCILPITTEQSRVSQKNIFASRHIPVINHRRLH